MPPQQSIPCNIYNSCYSIQTGKWTPYTNGGKFYINPSLDASGIPTSFTITLLSPITININSASAQFPLTLKFVGNANESTITNSDFLCDVTLDPTNVNRIYMTDCHFNVDNSGNNTPNPENNSTNLNIISKTSQQSPFTLAMTNCSFIYNGTTCITSTPSNTYVDSSNCSITLNELNNLYELSEPPSIANNFTINLGVNDSSNTVYNWGDITQNYNFNLLGPVTIQNATFRNLVTFTQNNNQLNFVGVTFNVTSNANNMYECSTDGLVGFNSCTLQVTANMFNNKKIWDFRSGSLVNIIMNTKIRFGSGNYTQFISGFYCNFISKENGGAIGYDRVDIELVANDDITLSNLTTVLGSQQVPINLPIGLFISTSCNANTINVTYFSDSSVGIANNTTLVPKITSSYIITPDSSGNVTRSSDPYNYALYIIDPLFNNINIDIGSSTFYNYNRNIIDPHINISNLPSDADYTYIGCSNETIDMGIENIEIFPHLVIYQPTNASYYSFLALKQDNTKYDPITFTVTSNINFVNTWFMSDITFNASEQKNITFNNSLISTGNNFLSLLNIYYNFNLSGGNVDISNSVVSCMNDSMIFLTNSSTINIHNSAVYMYGNRQILGASYNNCVFANNTIHIDEIEVNGLDLANLLTYSNNSVPTQNPFTNTNVICFDQPIVQLAYNGNFTSYQLNLSVLPDISDASITTDTSNSILVNSSINLTSNILINNASYDLSLPVLLNPSNLLGSNYGTITFPDVKFKTNPSSQLDYFIKSNNGISPTLEFNELYPTLFYLESYGNSNTLGVDATTKILGSPEGAVIILDVTGAYTLNASDELFNHINKIVYLNHTGNNTSYTLLSNTVVNVYLDNLYTDGSNSVVSLASCNCKAININDNYSYQHSISLTNIQLDISNNLLPEDGSLNYALGINTSNIANVSYSILSANGNPTIISNNKPAINIVNSSTNSGSIIINYITFNFNNISGPLINIDNNNSSIIPLNNNRSLSLLGNIFTGNNAKYLIKNNDSIWLKLNGCSGPFTQPIFWPYLYTIYDNDSSFYNSNSILQGDLSVVCAQAWDINTSVSITNWLGQTQSNNSDYNNNYGLSNKYGLIVDNVTTNDTSDNFFVNDNSGNSIGPNITMNNAPYNTSDGNLENIKLVQVFCQSNVNNNNYYPIVTIDLSKNMIVNQTTSHTGKLYYIDGSNVKYEESQPNVNTTSNKGLIQTTIDFLRLANANNLIILKPYLSVDVDMSYNYINNQNSGSKTYSKLYTETQNYDVNNGNLVNGILQPDVSLNSYLNNNFYIPTNGAFNTSTRLTYDVAGQTVDINDNAFQANNNPNPVEIRQKSTYNYGFVPIKGTLKFLTNITIDLSCNNTDGKLNMNNNNNPFNISITFPGIDSSNQTNSDPVVVYFNRGHGNSYIVNTTPKLQDYFTSLSNSYFTQNTTIISKIPPNQLWAYNLGNLDISCSIPLGNSGIDPNLILNNSITIGANSSLTLVDGSYNPNTGERIYSSVNYIGITIIKLYENNSQIPGYDMPILDQNGNPLHLNELFTDLLSYNAPNPNGSRGTIKFSKLTGSYNNNSPYNTLGYFDESDDVINYYNTFYRFKVTTYFQNTRDLLVQSQQMVYNLGDGTLNVSNSGTNNITPCIVNINNINIPFTVDIHTYEQSDSPVVRQQWNSTSSYTEDLSRNNTYYVSIITSGVVTGLMKPILKDNSGNNIHMTYVINNFINSTLDLSNNLDSYSTPYDDLNNIWYSNVVGNNNQVVTINGQNNYIWSYDTSSFPANYLVGDFSMNIIYDPSSNISNINNSSINNTSTVFYHDISGNNQLKQQVQFIVGKAINKNSNLEATIPIPDPDNIDNINNLFNLSDPSNCNQIIQANINNIQPTLQPTTAANNVVPLNKYTKHYIAFNTNAAGIKIDSSNNVQDSSGVNNVITITFTDENGNNVKDLNIDAGDGSNNNPTGSIVIPLTDGTNNNSNNTNVYLDESGNVWQFVYFNRVHEQTPQLETNYKTLNINYKVTSTSGTNGNLYDLTSTRKLTSVDYSNVGLVSVNMSQIFLGNWRITPSGDGQSLLFRNVTDGSNPYKLSITMDESQTGFTSPNFVNNILPHISVPLKNSLDPNDYPGESPLPPV
jgi:hypothetical protein